jgi:hypothetical protein
LTARGRTPDERPSPEDEDADGAHGGRRAVADGCEDDRRELVPRVALLTVTTKF